MKKMIPAFAGAIITMLSCIFAKAQKSVDISASDHLKNPSTSVAADKVTPETKDDHNYLYKINFKAVQHFKNTYTDITTETWAILKNGFVANFNSNSVYIRSHYDKQGNWLHTLKRYNETKLPEEVQELVRNAYEDYSITGVEEVSTNRNNKIPIYLVYIKLGTKCKIARICNGEIEEIRL